MVCLPDFIFYFYFFNFLSLLTLYSAIWANFVLFYFYLNDYMNYCLDFWWLWQTLPRTNWTANSNAVLSARTCFDHELRKIHQNLRKLIRKGIGRMPPFVSTAANWSCIQSLPVSPHVILTLKPTINIIIRLSPTSSCWILKQALSVSISQPNSFQLLKQLTVYRRKVKQTL